MCPSDCVNAILDSRATFVCFGPKRPLQRGVVQCRRLTWQTGQSFFVFVFNSPVCTCQEGGRWLLSTWITLRTAVIVWSTCRCLRTVDGPECLLPECRSLSIRLTLMSTQMDSRQLRTTNTRSSIQVHLDPWDNRRTVRLFHFYSLSMFCSIVSFVTSIFLVTVNLGFPDSNLTPQKWHYSTQYDICFVNQTT